MKLPAVKIPAAIAARLDASPAIVWNWRRLWRAHSVRLNALGAVLSFGLSAAIWVAPLFGVLWEGGMAFKWAAMLSGVLFVLALLARYLTQPEVSALPESRRGK